MKKKWLITSFEPFDGRSDNNSQLVVSEMKKIVADLNPTEWPFEFYYSVLPVEYDRCYAFLKDELTRFEKEGHRFDGILSIGEGAEEFKLETQANNIDDVPTLSDNAGVTRTEKVIIKDLDKNAVIPLRFPFEAFGRIRTSKNPGYYICNHLTARMGYEYAPNAKAPFFGFIHVPRTGQGGVFTADVCAAMIVNGFKKI